MIAEGKAGRLNVRIYEDRAALGKAAASDAAAAVKRVIDEKGYCSVIFAAAPSQNEFLAALCEEDSRRGGRIDFSKVHAYHMDEYVGLPEDAPQGFGNFLRRGIFEKVPFGKVEYLRASREYAPDEAAVAAEIERYSRLLEEDPADLVFLGIGENGHIAFNDPHVARFDDPAMVKLVSLDERCRMQQVHDGCFACIEEVPTHALTLTVPALAGAGELFCMVPAATKEEAVGLTVLGEIREKVPATIMRIHPHATLYVDRDSGKKLLEAHFGKQTE
ncbi:MAG: 6-phosphogluconolactonase [Firmicutes bacterium]|nr:6-phosphogluconolactonase [Bacillota bacterium]